MTGTCYRGRQRRLVEAEVLAISQEVARLIAREQVGDVVDEDAGVGGLRKSLIRESPFVVVNHQIASIRGGGSCKQRCRQRSAG